MDILRTEHFIVKVVKLMAVKYAPVPVIARYALNDIICNLPLYVVPVFPIVKYAMIIQTV